MPSLLASGSDKESTVATEIGVAPATSHVSKQARPALGDDTNTRPPVPKKGTAQPNAPRKGVAIKRKRALPDRPCDRAVYDDLTEAELFTMCDRDDVNIEKINVRIKQQIVDYLLMLDNKGMISDSGLDESEGEARSLPPPKTSERKLRTRKPAMRPTDAKPKTTKRKRGSIDEDDLPPPKPPRRQKLTNLRPEATPPLDDTATTHPAKPRDQMSVGDLKDVVLTAFVPGNLNVKSWYTLLKYAYKITLEEGEVSSLDPSTFRHPISKLMEKIVEHTGLRKEEDGGLRFLRLLVTRYDELKHEEEPKMKVAHGKAIEKEAKRTTKAQREENAKRLRDARQLEETQRRKEKAKREAEKAKKRGEERQREEQIAFKLANQDTKARTEVEEGISLETSSSSKTPASSKPKRPRLFTLQQELLDLRGPSIYNHKKASYDINRGIIKHKKWSMLWSRPSLISRRGYIRGVGREFAIDHALIPPYEPVGHVIRKRPAVQREVKDIFAYRKAKSLKDVSKEEWDERERQHRKGKKAMDALEDSKKVSKAMIKATMKRAMEEYLALKGGKKKNNFQDEILVAAVKSVEEDNMTNNPPKKQEAFSCSERKKREPKRKIIVEDGDDQEWRRELNQHLREDSEGLRKGGLASSRHSSASVGSSSKGSSEEPTARVNPRTGFLEFSGPAPLPKPSMPLDAIFAMKPVYRKPARDEDLQDDRRQTMKRPRLDHDQALKTTSRAGPKATSRPTQQFSAPSSSCPKKRGHEDYDRPTRANGSKGRSQRVARVDSYRPHYR
ncbi:uncharacterized protein BDZ99DRAFT_481872 [Mytilinidion resinicola]|uniref:Uncharacterized protein n=1 Tax=Mytilinidion resinicola TaxID=574789 RepID=A0A6A6Y5K1_9PEZI|nr:uncharacterized protein BDZ99DRAFT_481872 [Mytilinidion resinicola]KAF2803899.1 hypothetical protein BDZ99DRAFT_481872 [Mytilinidion resinicola]